MPINRVKINLDKGLIDLNLQVLEVAIVPFNPIEYLQFWS